MKLRRISLLLLLFFSLSAFALTDEQVIAYIKQQTAAGKTEQQISQELLAKGVTPAQAKRIKARFEAEQAQNQSATSSTPNAVLKDADRGRQRQTHENLNEVSLSTVEGVSREVEDITDDAKKIMDSRQVYGHKVFNSQSLTFEPNENMATPQNYRLGPGDEVVIDIWGTSEDHLRQTISPEGSIMISQLGPVYLNGLTIADANKHIKSAFSKKYAGVADSETDIQVTLGQVRSIQVDIMGEVATPGTFRLSPFSSVFHALYRAGGINDIGSLRNIQVLRNGKKVAGIDIYKYLFEGKPTGNIRLQEGDVIIVPPYEQLVQLEGNVKRPMYYEIKPGETIKTLLDYAGGFTGDAYSGMVRVSRQSGTENELHNIEKADFQSYKLQDGDILTVGTILDRYANRVELKGAANRPGLFAIGNEIRTVKDLIRKADGLTDDAFTERALLYREGPDLQLEVLSLDLDAILKGSAPDVTLKRNDLLVVSSLNDILDNGSIKVFGEVTEPGTYQYARNMTLKDAILQAGGLKEGASTARINISRRIVNPNSLTPTEQLSENFDVALTDGLKLDSGEDFILQPYDEITVRKSPGYAEQEYVTLGGEVLFDGDYAIQKRGERLTSFIQRAGGLIEGAYIKGAQLTRKLSDEEYRMRQETLRIAMINQSSQGDSIALSKIQVSDRYNVGIDLEKALENPGSTYDIVIRPGDNIFIPEMQSTVSISGDVMFPNTVVYVPGKNINYYVDQAGGYGHSAKKGKAFVVYMNGSVALAKRNTVLEPGCQIIVPSKPQGGGVDWTKILAFATSFSSVATMAATITNIFKK